LLKRGNALGTLGSFGQIPMGFGTSNDILSLVAEGLNLLEGLNLEKSMDSVEQVLEHGLIESQAPSLLKQHCGRHDQRSKI
jgi:hypothetical protein